MYVCMLSHDGEILVHRNMQAAPEPFRKAVAPYRDGLVVAVECLFTWYWLADLCADQGMPFVKWAFSEAAALFLRNTPQGQQLLARLEKKHDKGKALSILAHQLARAVSDMLKRQTAFDMDIFLRPSGSRAGEPGVSLDTQGMSLKRAYFRPL